MSYSLKSWMGGEKGFKNKGEGATPQKNDKRNDELGYIKKNNDL